MTLPTLDPGAYLSSALEALFMRQLAVDRRHAIRVAARLIEIGRTDEDLIAAALLHDVGKAGMSVSLLDRVSWVMLNWLAPGMVPIATRWIGPRWVALATHRATGAALARQAGATDVTCALIGGTAMTSGLGDRAAALEWADDTV